MDGIIRRREAIEETAISCPYITDGLIFWLDGINQGGVSGEWKDLIGGKIFTLVNCTQNATGVYFNGSSSYGYTLGAISSNYDAETIEAAIDKVDTNNRCILCPYYTSPIGIGLVFSNGSGWGQLNLDGVSKRRFAGNSDGKWGTFSANTSYIVEDGVQKSWTNVDSWAKNQSSYTYLGARYTTSRLRYFNSTIHSIRIYNRKLSVAEMQANQAVDVTRFGLT